MHAIQIGEVILFAGYYVPPHFIPCKGKLFKRADYPELSKLMGNNYGGDDENFGTPNLPNVDTHAQWLMNAESMSKYDDSSYPTGSIILGLKTLKPKGFEPCNGQLLPISDSANRALLALIGIKFGGDGLHTFGLPNYVHEDDLLGYFIAIAPEYSRMQANDIVGRIWIYPYGAEALNSPDTLIPCDGTFFRMSQLQSLCSVIQNQYGARHEEFAIPTVNLPLEYSTAFIVTYGLLLYPD